MSTTLTISLIKYFLASPSGPAIRWDRRAIRRARRPEHRVEPMDAHLAILADGKKFLWDGCVYDCDEDARRAAATYQQAHFAVRIEQAGEKSLVYTRRVVSSIAVAARE